MAEHPTHARQLVTASLDGTIRTWDTDDAVCLFSIDLGVPITHLCAPAIPRGASGHAGGALIYVATALRGGATGDDFPLGHEVACLRPRPLATAFAFTVAASGRRRAPPQVLVLEVDLVLRRPTRRLAQGQGFLVGLDGRYLLGGVAGRAVVFALRRRLYIWRSGCPGGEGGPLTLQSRCSGRTHCRFGHTHTHSHTRMRRGVAHALPPHGPPDDLQPLPD